ATGPSSALAPEFALPSASGALSEFNSAKAWLLSSAEAAPGSSAARAAETSGKTAHDSAHKRTPRSAASSARRQHVATLFAGSLVRRNIDVSRLRGSVYEIPGDDRIGIVRAGEGRFLEELNESWTAQIP